ncbi:MAG: DUF5615 family PIN-like protein [Planctomycetes bacterium]|nr:DUF5615 family PIN-like protein [Planctomycetota bacterium]
MPVSFYFDVHVPHAIAKQLRRLQVDVLLPQEDGTDLLSDEELLERATKLGRAIVTFDIRFKVMAEDWQAKNRPFAGLVFAHQQKGTIGQLVQDLELIAKALEPSDMENRIERIPF